MSNDTVQLSVPSWRLILAEGAAMLVLEDETFAESRGATILGYVEGAAVTSDGFHIVAPDPPGKWAAAAMAKAIKDAGHTPNQVAGIFAHATGTSAGDEAEAVAIGQVFGESVSRVPVTAVKSMLGHHIGASGPVAAVLAVEGLRAGSLPPIPNLEEPGVGAIEHRQQACRP